MTKTTVTVDWSGLLLAAVAGGCHGLDQLLVPLTCVSMSVVYVSSAYLSDSQTTR